MLQTIVPLQNLKLPYTCKVVGLMPSRGFFTFIVGSHLLFAMLPVVWNFPMGWEPSHPVTRILPGAICHHWLCGIHWQIVWENTRHHKMSLLGTYTLPTCRPLFQAFQNSLNPRTRKDPQCLCKTGRWGEGCSLECQFWMQRHPRWAYRRRSEPLICPRRSKVQPKWMLFNFPWLTPLPAKLRRFPLRPIKRGTSSKSASGWTPNQWMAEPQVLGTWIAGPKTEIGNSALGPSSQLNLVSPDFIRKQGFQGFHAYIL